MNRLYRSRKNRMIAGVAGGLAEYFEVDVILVRLLWVLSVLLGGTGILAYIIAVIVIPDQKGAPEYPGTGHNEAGYMKENGARKQKMHRNAGLLLIGLGSILLAHELLPWAVMRFSWPLLLIALGIFILLRAREEAGK